MAKKVRDVMHDGCECIGENESLMDAARKMQQLDVGVLPICGENDRLKGMLTDRDIVVKALARGNDPSSTMVGSLAQGKPLTIMADASIDQALDMMREHAVKRLPVLDENKRLCGMISEADIATAVSAQKTGQLVGAIASEQPQHF
ncbi:MAG TPA: CBS domain-containing protein [Gaiellaceae bacterium]|nr:CBS domain-containing protein [Gaiellaceae bacterium]